LLTAATIFVGILIAVDADAERDRQDSATGYAKRIIKNEIAIVEKKATNDVGRRRREVLAMST